MSSQARLEFRHELKSFLLLLHKCHGEEHVHGDAMTSLAFKVPLNEHLVTLV